MEKKNKITLQEISEKTGISTSTLSRALNNCPGVDYATWQAAHDAAQQYGYTPKERERRPIGILFPTVPEYFWGPALATVKSTLIQKNITYRLNTYPPGFPPEDLCKLIDSMVAEGVKILLMPVRLESVAAYLDTLRDKLTVFQICEYCSIRNSFVFAADGLRDGRALAILIREKYPDSKVLLLESQTPLARLRLRGFREEYPADQILGELTLPVGLLPQQRASVYARYMAEFCGENAPDIVVCSSGILPSICQAIIKCRWKGKTRCAGYEYPPDLERYTADGLVLATVEQAMQEECIAAASAAADFFCSGIYPSEKYTYLPGKLHDLL